MLQSMAGNQYGHFWLQQLENGCAEWGGEPKKLEFRRALLWNPVQCNQTYKTQPTARTQQRGNKEATGKPTMAKRGTKGLHRIQ